MEIIDDSLVWYASYGSNMSMDRFLCYIQGGTPKGADTSNPGCKDRTPPVASEEIYIQSALYFAHTSAKWGGHGIGFLKNNFGAGDQSLGRMYLISKSQFNDVVKQENSGKLVSIDFDKAMSEGQYIFVKSLYNTIVYLGKQDNYPIFTFTSTQHRSPNPPTPNYLKMIVQGITEVYPLSNEEIAEYLLKCEGIVGHFSYNDLLHLIAEL